MSKEFTALSFYNKDLEQEKLIAFDEFLRKRQQPLFGEYHKFFSFFYFLFLVHFYNHAI